MVNYSFQVDWITVSLAQPIDMNKTVLYFVLDDVT